MMHTCSLCLSPIEIFTTWKARTYFRCPICSLIQLESQSHPSRAEEQSEYLMHNNDSADEGYRRFLSRVTIPVLGWLKENHTPKVQLLDFGCGPGPTISVVLGEHGWKMENYDPMFYPTASLLEAQYDLVVCAEAAEHFYTPKTTWTQMIGLIKAKGRLIVMTHVSDKYGVPSDFRGWHYIREQSHVSLYHTDTMHWIANAYGFRVTTLDRNVFCFERIQAFL